MRRASLIFLCLSVAANLLADPQIKSTDGDLTEKGKLILRGEGFGRKDPAKPLVWADFETSLDPSNQGLRQKWDQVHDMVPAAGGFNGGHCAQGVPGSGNWTLGVDYDAWTRDGQKLYVSRRIKTNFQ